MRARTWINFFFVTLLVWLGVSSSARLTGEIIYWPQPSNDQARQKAESVDCVRNLRRIVVVAQLWANDNHDEYPPGFQTFADDLAYASIPSETVLCPANRGHAVTTNWVGFDWKDVDYEWMPQPNWLDPGAVCCRCLIHSNIALVDGHVELASGFRSGWPAILAAPLAQDATPGSDVRFQVAIAPDAVTPLNYQWRREHLFYSTNVTFVTNGGCWTTNWYADFVATVLSGQTNATLLLTNVQPPDSDYYSVAISNGLGAAISSPVRLFVDDAIWFRATNANWSSVNCVNNLRQVRQLADLWAGDHNSQMPVNLSVMTNHYGLPMFGWPVALFCRSDTARTVPPGWEGVDMNDTSYEVLPGDAQDPNSMFCHCKFHGFYARMDGLVVSRPSFTGLRAQPNDLVELAFTVFRGATNRLEASTDLVHWATLNCYSGISGEVQLVETNNLPRRFYRIRVE